MLNAQLINTTQLTQIDTTVEGILVNGVRGERVERCMKRPYCASKHAKHAALPAWLSESFGCSSSSDLSGRSERWQGAASTADARPAAAASMPAPIWARLVVLNALSS